MIIFTLPSGGWLALCALVSCGRHGNSEAYHLCTSPQNADTRAEVWFDAAAGLEAEGDLQVEAAVGGAGAVGAAGDVVGLAEEGRT